LEQQLATLEQLSTSTAMLDKVWWKMWHFQCHVLSVFLDLGILSIVCSGFGWVH
jgi:hypothetical protein